MGNLSKVEKKNIQMYKEKLRKHSIKAETLTTEFDDILDGEQNDTRKPRKKAKRKDVVRKPAWRDQVKAQKVSQATLENFAIQLENRQTIGHI